MMHDQAEQLRVLMGKAEVTLTPVALIPCPFCGGSPDVHAFSDDNKGNWCVMCPCLADKGPYDTKEEAIEKWNLRTQPDQGHLAKWLTRAVDTLARNQDDERVVFLLDFDREFPDGAKP